VQLENRHKSKKAITITIMIMITIVAWPRGDRNALRDGKGELGFRVLATFFTHKTQ
jgi:hypothetical protein